ncbi:MAG: PD-(D/E)XK nuclease family protein [Candidatus Marinimicrobia bacterium]|nr:PD-(D/E)XK nuclease family protein [Candidatus Neomarinimicrobiota bacterium]
MNSLFNKLLHTAASGDRIPTEDYFTEIFVHLMNEYQTILFDFVKSFNLTEIIPDSYVLQTQVTFREIRDHNCESRPDIYLELTNDDRKEIIFIESKIGSNEGENQLKRYAEQLDDLSDIYKRTLVFITRDYEPKNKITVMKDCKRKVSFVQLRWYEVYRFFKKYENEILIKEVIKFMEENNMNLSNQFTSIDILTLTNFPRVRKMLDETMQGVVQEKFKEVCGSISKDQVCLTQLKYNNRYIYKSDQENGMWCGYGYWFDTGDINNYPKVELILEISPSSEARAQVISVFKEIINMNSDKWEGYKINDPKVWSSIRHSKNMREIVSEEDHINFIKQFFIDSIKELSNVKDNYPNLPWFK